MKLRLVAAVALLAGIGVTTWRHELVTVARPGARPQPLAIIEPSLRKPVEVDVVLPAVPIGMRRLHSGDGPLLVHYWAPWERNAKAQAAALDSLRRLPEMEGLHVVMVCFDPFPSVSRFVTRQRLRLAVLLDGRGELRKVLPCPSVPYTWVIDRKGRIAAAQAGEVDWLSAETRRALKSLIERASPADSPPLTGTPPRLLRSDSVTGS